MSFLVKGEEIVYTFPHSIVRPRDVDAVRESVLQSILSWQNRKLILNFENVRQMGSDIIQPLVRLLRELISRQGQLILYNMQPSVYEVLQTARLTRLFEIRQECPA